MSDDPDRGGEPVLDKLSDQQLEAAAQRRAEEHLEACEDALYVEEEQGEPSESPAIGPFCGCTTCVVREVLHAAWPSMLELARREVARVALWGPEP